MKKYFVIAVMALVAVFEVSCNKDKKIDLVGHAWNYHGTIDTMNMNIVIDITLAFNDADSLDATTSIVTPDRNETKTVRRAYTWDGEKNLLITRPDDDNAGTTRNLTYNKETEEFSMSLDQIEGEQSAQLISLTGIDVLIFKKVK